MDIAFQLALISGLVLVNGFFAAAEIALVSVSDVRMRSLAERGSKQARLVLKVTEDSTRFLATIQVGITLAGFLTSATAATELAGPLERTLKPFIGKVAEPIALVGVTVIFALITLVVGELVPKKLALRHSEAFALIAIAPIHWLGRVINPMVKSLSEITNLILRVTGNPVGDAEEHISVEEVKAMVDAARTGGAVGEQERRIIYGAVELSNITARAIMVPRVEIQYLKASTTLEEAYQIVSENAHTRLPVCDEDLDNLLGILHVKDLIRPLPGLMQNPPSLRELLRPASYVPEGQPATDLLRHMKKNRLHMMIVRDEFGGTAGLVTLEDVLEEIVGEIRDEYDAEEEREFRHLSDHEASF
ncbi:hemolysin family protein [Neosynechococcus sphagnicola]|uniref:hemolysin family protein n=1 Tax=Neosynechococcus sphagnicola TaxID=1501145 RepID=UPI000AFA4745|nr:hemolysin family protein [Neosynechococcus sphagnicola]